MTSRLETEVRLLHSVVTAIENRDIDNAKRLLEEYQGVIPS